MVATPIKTEKRLTIQTGDIAEDTTTIRSLDWDRDRFDIEFGLQNGTTYNSYIIRGDKIALID
ncbi:MAG: diflavin flavoprotein A, partial [Crocosphaera sp.]